MSLEKAVRGLLDCLAQCSITSGVCCCGDNMDTHDNGMSSGHAPVDSGAYYTQQAIDEVKAELDKGSNDATRSNLC